MSGKMLPEDERLALKYAEAFGVRSKKDLMVREAEKKLVQGLSVRGYLRSTVSLCPSSF